MSKQKVKMVTAILILLYSAKRGISIDMLKRPQNTHSQKLRIGVSQKYHPEWYFLFCPIRTIYKNVEARNNVIHYNIDLLVWAQCSSLLAQPGGGGYTIVRCCL